MPYHHSEASGGDVALSFWLIIKADDPRVQITVDRAPLQAWLSRHLVADLVVTMSPESKPNVACHAKFEEFIAC